MSQNFRKKQVVQPTFTEDELLFRSISRDNCSKCCGKGARGTHIVRNDRHLILCKCVPTSLLFYPLQSTILSVPFNKGEAS